MVEMKKYKLTIVEETLTPTPIGNKASYKEVCGIGIFDDEQQLMQWATENIGELGNC
jgi:hypothetical protein